MIETKDSGIKIGDTITVTIDRPIGSRHPKHKEIIYPINYGYIEGVIAPDGEEQDVYILGGEFVMPPELVDKISALLG